MTKNCNICGEPLHPDEEMFFFHGSLGDCPKPPFSKIKKEVVVAYAIKELRDGGYCIEVKVNDQPYQQEKFDTLDECERAYEDLLAMQRQLGAIDVPEKHN